MSAAPEPLAHVPLITLDDLRAMLALYSGSARHLFIHIPKNAGVSMRMAPQLRWKMVGVHKTFLKDRAYLMDLRRAMGAAGQHHGIAHARLCDVSPRILSRVQPLAVIRNPFARVVSRFRFAQLIAEQGSKFASVPTTSFEAFLDTRHEDGNRPFFWHRAVRGWYPQVDYVTDASGRIGADLLRQEHLTEESAAYFRLSSPIQPRNVTRKGSAPDWKSFYTPQTIQIVADWYAKDIETFGFDFDTPATRNTWAQR
ncbi:sulfotransferase family 2 domain-containing protein [Stagnihabitans tardus]|uniref:Sulfotransferase family 2 domain-containing protein n=1 Tax=Stagnihabitans tardus TaxID=2699202 RepID=A0AAE5BVW0_9RHOB|nr:sulfotransferase family 2 domain-containing protein [Stagnihabitans tardus]NBZ87663.1 sulfotransferase family 2 domain-containing protein [Stagnihabitans tardus]